jgi:hypothetical protein
MQRADAAGGLAARDLGQHGGVGEIADIGRQLGVAVDVDAVWGGVGDDFPAAVDLIEHRLEGPDEVVIRHEADRGAVGGCDHRAVDAKAQQLDAVGGPAVDVVGAVDGPEMQTARDAAEFPRQGPAAAHLGWRAIREANVLAVGVGEAR